MHKEARFLDSDVSACGPDFERPYTVANVGRVTLLFWLQQKKYT